MISIRILQYDPFDLGMVGVRVTQSGGLFGHAFVRFHGGADWEWNLAARQDDAPEVYTALDNGHELLIHALNYEGEEELTIPFVIETGSEGTVQLQADPIQIPEIQIETGSALAME